MLQWLPCLYPIPVSVEGYGLVYNKEIFKDAGIDASTLTSYDAIDKAFADLQNQIDSGKLKDKYPQLEAVEEYAAKETWIPGLHTLNAPLACEYSRATELRNSDQLGLKYADSLKALLDLETKYTTSKDTFVNAVKKVEESKNSADTSNVMYPGDVTIDYPPRINNAVNNSMVSEKSKGL